MPYTPLTLKAWITANPNYDAFAGTVSGKPLIYQAAATGTPTLTATTWFVWDKLTEFPDLAQSPATADISTTGSTARKLIATVPDAPSPSELTIMLGEDTDAGIDAIEGLVAAFKAKVPAGKFLLGHFMGVAKKSEIYEASVNWSGSLMGAFPDPVETTISVTPNLGGYHKFEVITNI